MQKFKNKIALVNAPYEILFCLCLIGLQVYLILPFLKGETTLTHDNIYWNYPNFIYYFSNLDQGHLPIFNFFSRFGELFVPVAAQTRLWDPIQTILGLSLWKIFSDKVQAFNWFRYIVLLLQFIGTYLFFRVYTKSLWVRFVLAATILFSSFFYGSFRQDGIISQFLWVPFIMLLVRNQFIKKTPSLLSSYILGILIGCSFQSYFFIMPIIFLCLYVFFSWIAGDKLKIFESFGFFAKHLVVIMVPCLFMGGINLYSYLSLKDSVFPARLSPMTVDLIASVENERLSRGLMQQEGLRADSEKITKEGSSSRMWDYVQLLYPKGNSQINPTYDHNFGEPSEGYLYFGLLPLILGLIGISFFKDQEGWVWLNLFALSVLLSLGPHLKAYVLLLKIFPPLGFVRHTVCLVMFVAFYFFYFITVGGDWVYDNFERLYKKSNA